MAGHSNQYQEKTDMFTLCQLLLCVKNTDERIILFIKESLCKPAKLKAEHASSMVLLLHKSVCVCVCVTTLAINFINLMQFQEFSITSTS